MSSRRESVFLLHPTHTGHSPAGSPPTGKHTLFSLLSFLSPVDIWGQVERAVLSTGGCRTLSQSLLGVSQKRKKKYSGERNFVPGETHTSGACPYLHLQGQPTLAKTEAVGLFMCLSLVKFPKYVFKILFWRQALTM